MSPEPIRQAMVLAAGRGERLKPLTDTTPKPLLMVNDRPLLIHHLAKLAVGGFRKVIINLGWLGEKIPVALAPWLETKPLDRLEVIYSKEPPGALETAGGIVHALGHFEDQPFALINADILSDLDYQRLTSMPAKANAHLVLVDNPPHHPTGDFVLDGSKLRSIIDLSSEHSLTYAGIGVFSPKLFANLAPGHRPLRPVLESAIQAGLLTGQHFQGQWMDIGTPERLRIANQLDWR